VALFGAAGLRDVEAGVLTVSASYPSFDAWWHPYTLGVGPAGGYVARLGEERREALLRLLQDQLPEPPFEITASAWCARGVA
jgi:hypothetical protein